MSLEDAVQLTILKADKRERSASGAADASTARSRKLQRERRQPGTYWQAGLESTI